MTSCDICDSNKSLNGRSTGDYTVHICGKCDKEYPDKEDLKEAIENEKPNQI